MRSASVSDRGVTLSHGWLRTELRGPVVRSTSRRLDVSTRWLNRPPTAMPWTTSPFCLASAWACLPLRMDLARATREVAEVKKRLPWGSRTSGGKACAQEGRGQAHSAFKAVVLPKPGLCRRVGQIISTRNSLARDNATPWLLWIGVLGTADSLLLTANRCMRWSMSLWRSERNTVFLKVEEEAIRILRDRAGYSNVAPFVAAKVSRVVAVRGPVAASRLCVDWGW